MGSAVVLLFVGILIAVVAGVVYQDNQRKAKIAALQNDYQRALTTLRAQPTDRAAYDRALTLGRSIIPLAAETRGAVVFTEVTLQADLAATTRTS